MSTGRGFRYARAMSVVKTSFLIAALIAAMKTAAPAAVRIQYDQIREVLSSADLPAYAAFDREYAAVSQSVPAPDQPVSAAALRSQMLRMMAEEELRERFERMANGMALGLLSAASQVNAVAHAVVAPQLARMSTEMEKREYEAANARMQRQAAELNARVVRQSLRQMPALQRISIWDDAVRIDNPLDGSAIIYRAGQYIAIDTLHHQYRIVNGEPPTSQCPPEMPSFTVNSTTPRTVGGMAVDEYDISAQLSENKAAAVSSTMIVDVWNASMPAALLSIAQADTCAPLPSGRLVIYSAQESHISNPNLHALEMNSVLMRGHIRTLTDQDAALFGPPPGYERII